GPLLMCAVPGRVLTKGVFCGRKVLSAVRPRLAEQERKFYVAMLISIFLATLAALVGSQFVTSPLSAILSAIQQINREEYEARIRFPERGDEFASLGRAFNDMAQGLQEGRILARYVSTTVQEAVSDSTLNERATEGEMTEVTVLFTGLEGFDDYRRLHTPDEVFALLAINLESANAAVSACGGEIDKVMGEKILILFRHDRFLSGAQAMHAALKVIRHMRDDLQKRGIHPLFGLNSGTVVAGFVGAQNVRMDYTVIGDPVNLAARLVALAQSLGGSGVITSGLAVRLMSPEIVAEKLDITRVKGKTQEVEAYRLQL
ncbi:MAG TPA: adenylate/guanylate cyclase domain-containing protein, partial [Candidatus Ozemobacteraceae bacterium]|nr:adenylate/guanylate cyclase domain-containing protein [Candidatus Ozemobacteraceae bacterium]